MSKCELQDLLEMLLEKNIIRNKIIVKPKKPSIFDFDNNNFDYIDYGKNKDYLFINITINNIIRKKNFIFYFLLFIFIIIVYSNSYF